MYGLVRACERSRAGSAAAASAFRSVPVNSDCAPLYCPAAKPFCRVSPLRSCAPPPSPGCSAWPAPPPDKFKGKGGAADASWCAPYAYKQRPDLGCGGADKVSGRQGRVPRQGRLATRRAFQGAPCSKQGWTRLVCRCAAGTRRGSDAYAPLPFTHAVAHHPWRSIPCHKVAGRQRRHLLVSAQNVVELEEQRCGGLTRPASCAGLPTASVPPSHGPPPCALLACQRWRLVLPQHHFLRALPRRPLLPPGTCV